MEKTLKELLEEAKAEIANGKNLKMLLDAMAGRIDQHDVGELTAAVKQLEKDFAEHTKSIEKKLERAQRAAFDGRGRYRGHFASEDAARSFGLFVVGHCKNIKGFQEALASDYPDIELDAKAFTSSDAAAVIPETWEASLMNMLEDFGVFERHARRRPMSSDIDHMTKKTGRTTAAPLAEATAASETKPTLAQIDLTARKWAAYTEIPSEVSEDSIVAVAEMIAEDMAEAHAEAVDEAGFIGDGSGTYNQITGVTNALIAAATVTGAGTTWSDLTLANFEQTASLPVTKAFTNAWWYCSHQFFWQVMTKLMLASGGVNAGEVEGRRRPMFMGYPVEFVQKMPTATAVDQLCAVFGNLRQGAVFGDRRALEVKASEHFKFSSDLTAMMSTRRFDINIVGAGTGSTIEVLSGLQTAAA